jgi:hypothetical protein
MGSLKNTRICGMVGETPRAPIAGSIETTRGGRPSSTCGPVVKVDSKSATGLRRGRSRR